MPFRVKIISPLKADDADIRRRQVRYSEHASPDTRVQVVNLHEGPVALDTSGDMIFCEYAVFQQGINTRREDFDAILIDCVFDPAVDAIREQTGIPTIGPTHATLPLIALVAKKFSIVARAEHHCRRHADLVNRYGYGDYLVSTRALGITYPQAKDPKVFNEAMYRQLQAAVEQDGAQAVMMGSTTMALSDDIVSAARGIPLFLPGMVALRTTEGLWNQGLLR